MHWTLLLELVNPSRQFKTKYVDFFLPKILSVKKTPGPNPDAVEPAYGSDLYVVGILIGSASTTPLRQTGSMILEETVGTGTDS